jgi:hypothetical protein
MLGYVYIITSNNYRQKSIYKIGFSTNLIKRLKLFNATRMDDDLFYCVRHWRTVHYSKLEAFLHSQLQQYRKKNEFFKVSLNLVEDAVKKFTEVNGPQFFYDDVVLIKKELFEVQYNPFKKIFLYYDPGCVESRGSSRIRYVDDVEMRNVVAEWLSCVDLYGLLKYTADHVLDRLVDLLRAHSEQTSLLVLGDDLADGFRRLKL